MGYLHARRPSVPYQRQIVEMTADAAYVAPANLGDGSTILITGAITGARAITLPTNAFAGQTVRVARDSGATGAFDVTPDTLVGIAVSEWADFVYDGSAWVHVAFGAGVA